MAGEAKEGEDCVTAQAVKKRRGPPPDPYAARHDMAGYMQAWRAQRKVDQSMVEQIPSIASLIGEAKSLREQAITGSSRRFLDDVVRRLEFDAQEFERLKSLVDVYKPARVVRFETISAVIVKIVTLLSQVDVMLGLGEHSIKLFTNDERDWLLDVAHGRIEIGDPKAGWAGPMNVRTADGGRTHYSPDLRSPPDPDGG